MPISKDRQDKRFHQIWCDMKYRCNNIKCKAYKNYGGRGIKVCVDWDKYENFKKDMYDSYNKYVLEFGEKQTTLDRIDPNKGYELNNCRWANKKIQRVNIRNKAIYQAENLITGEIIEFNNCAEFCKQYGFTRQRVVDCIAGNQKKHKGYKFTRLTNKER